MKHHYFYRFFTYSVKRRAACKRLLSGLKRPAPSPSRGEAKVGRDLL